LRSRATSKAVKIKICLYKTIPVAVHGSETQPMTEMYMERLSTWDRKILTRFYAPVVEYRIWRIRPNKEVRVLYKDIDVVADIKKKILGLIGHLVRMDHGRVVVKIF
jgi:hypothetical protein